MDLKLLVDSTLCETEGGGCQFEWQEQKDFFLFFIFFTAHCERQGEVGASLSDKNRNHLSPMATPVHCEDTFSALYHQHFQFIHTNPVCFGKLCQIWRKKKPTNFLPQCTVRPAPVQCNVVPQHHFQCMVTFQRSHFLLERFDENWNGQSALHREPKQK